MPEAYSAREAADKLGVSPYTVKRWIREGHISAKRVGPYGHWRVPASEIRRITQTEAQS